MTVTSSIRALLDPVRVIPVVVIDDASKSIDLAGALRRGGVNIIEITLRTTAAFPAAASIIREYPDLIVGMGTVTEPAELDEAIAIGAQFAVSPGFTSSLATHAQSIKLPYLPGVCTASEVMHAMELGLDTLKFFPAELSGGTEMLRQFLSLFPQVQFCPTGGITQAMLADYLAVENVCCVGGSWLATADAITASDWDGVAQRVRTALKIAETSIL